MLVLSSAKEVAAAPSIANARRTPSLFAAPAAMLALARSPYAG